MSDLVVLGERHEPPIMEMGKREAVSESTMPETEIPEYSSLQLNFTEATGLVDDIVLKKYLYRLADLDVVPLDDSLKKIGDIRLFKITEMVYQNNEYSTYKFASAFSAVQNLNCGIFIMADSDGKKTDFYMGVRSFDDKRTTKSLKDTLRNSLSGQFPGVKTQDLLDSDAEVLLSQVSEKNIAAVSCVAKNKDEQFKDNENFIQGLEKLVTAMRGQAYTIIVLAKSTPSEQLEEIRKAYEMIYTQLSPFSNMQLSYGTNTALSISNALSHGTTVGKTYSRSTSYQKGISVSKGISESNSVTKTNVAGTLAKSIGSVALGIASIATAPLTGGASVAAAAAIAGGYLGLQAIPEKNSTGGKGTSENGTKNNSSTEGENFGESENRSVNNTDTKGVTSGTSNNMTLTMQNKTLLDTLDKIEQQLNRIDECESIGMWECAAYVLSDTQETVEMAAGMYKALMKGENSGIETSAVNYWGRQCKQRPVLRDYIINFVHPVFKYPTDKSVVPVTAVSLVSSNELAIQMGLPRKSVCGLPVIDHAEFGQEVIHYDQSVSGKELSVGHIFSMGEETKTDVKLDKESLTMHTFVTGSTGAGKSNAIYQILSRLVRMPDTTFMVVEPAKGEYKDIFGTRRDMRVSVYGTNPKLTPLLRINPFRFPATTHIYEHMDRLVEIFNVCWPMYAAMPAVLKAGLENAYIAAGWDLEKSENRTGVEVYPTFASVAREVRNYLDSSEYSDENKGNYKGALLTRLESLTNGINGMIFTADDLSDEELFDRNVIVDLSRVGSMETKALIMGILVVRLQEYRSGTSAKNSRLKHVTVLEEAHNLLKRTSTEQSSEGANLLGKSVEMLANSIAEMRTYGEAFIIADQAPGLLDMSVIRNTNTKIILRLPDYSDRELVGRAANLNEDQIEELAKLRTGVAAVYQNNWISPVLCQFDRFEGEEEAYIKPEERHYSDNAVTEVLYIIMKSEIRKELDDPLFEEKIVRDVSVSKMPDFLKVKILEYLVAKNDRPKAKQLAEIAYQFFEAEKALDAAAGAEDIEKWKECLVDTLKPSVKGFPEEEVETVLALLVHEHFLIHKAYEPIYVNYMEYLGNKRNLL